MRDYSNGGFFFIDAAPIQAAGTNGLKIYGIFEDAKRAIAGGKVFVLTHIQLEQDGTSVKLSGVFATAGLSGTAIQATATAYNDTYLIMITNEDIITFVVD